MNKRRIYVFIGTTAELIKLIPVIRELLKRKIIFSIIASGQNDIQFEEFATEIGNVEINYAVTPKSKESSVILFIYWAIRTFFSVFVGMRSNFSGLNKTNSLFIVQGDTVSSLIGSLVAYVYGLTLVHIESGLRSYNFFEPFPEEVSRYLISKLADIHFCPNNWAVKNLRNNKGEKINTFQNTLIETNKLVMKRKSYHPLVKQLEKQKKQYFVLVVHRQEHVLFSKRSTTEILQFVFNSIPSNLQCILLVHDLSASFIRALSLIIPASCGKNMKRITRLPYGDFMYLLHKSEFMVTDGGSNQEELYYMGKPCLLLRNYTERIEGLGQNVVLSKNKTQIIKEFLQNYKNYEKPSIVLNEKPSEIIVNYLMSYGG